MIWACTKGLESSSVTAVKKAVMRLRKTEAHGTKGREALEGAATAIAAKSPCRKAHRSSEPSWPAQTADSFR